jgi:hypothetical protein
MTKKTVLLILALVALAGFSFYLNKDRFRSEGIQIGERWVPPKPGMVRRGQKADSRVLLFLLDRKLELTSLKVVPLADVRTNKYPHAIWALTTESNSIPVKDFFYGVTIRGMKPTVKGALAAPLDPNSEYRLFLEAGPVKATYDFFGAPKVP